MRKGILYSSNEKILKDRKDQEQYWVKMDKSLLYDKGDLFIEYIHATWVTDMNKHKRMKKHKKHKLIEHLEKKENLKRMLYPKFPLPTKSKMALVKMKNKDAKMI